MACNSFLPGISSAFALPSCPHRYAPIIRAEPPHVITEDLLLRIVLPLPSMIDDDEGYDCWEVWFQTHRLFFSRPLRCTFPAIGYVVPQRVFSLCCVICPSWVVISADKPFPLFWFLGFESCFLSFPVVPPWNRRRRRCCEFFLRFSSGRDEPVGPPRTHKKDYCRKR